MVCSLSPRVRVGLEGATFDASAKPDLSIHCLLQRRRRSGHISKKKSIKSDRTSCLSTAIRKIPAYPHGRLDDSFDERVASLYGNKPWLATEALKCPWDFRRELSRARATNSSCRYRRRATIRSRLCRASTADRRVASRRRDTRRTC